MTDAHQNDLANFAGLPVIDDMNALLEAQLAAAGDNPSEQVIASAGLAALQQAIESSKQRLLDADNEEWVGDFTAAEIEALLARMPYLQICNSDADAAYDRDLTFIRSTAGWMVHDYWHAFSTSPGEHLYNTDIIAEDDEGGSGGRGMPPGVGTIVKQGFDTATQMIKLAQQRGWKGIYIIDGHRRMQWAAWVAAQNAGMLVYNYQPDEEERDRLTRLRRNEEVIDKLRVDLRSKLGMSRK